jgi:galactoside O-acetyltransferase
MALLDFNLFDDQYLIRGYRGEYHSHKIRITDREKRLLRRIKFVLGIYSAYIRFLIKIMPNRMERICRTYTRGGRGFLLRAIYYKTKLRKMGQNTLIDTYALIWSPKNVSIGSNCHIDIGVVIEGGTEKKGRIDIGDHVHVTTGSLISGRGGLHIGNNAGISAGCRIYTASNYHTDPQNRYCYMSAASKEEHQYVVEKPVWIGKEVFIGVNTVILPGVTIGDGAVVGACSLVTDDIPPYTIAVGVPAKVVKERPRGKLRSVASK